MHNRGRGLSAFAISSAFVVTQVFGIGASARPAEARSRYDWSSQPAPIRVAPRRTPGPRVAPEALKVTAAVPIRHAHGVRLAGPRMLRTAELQRAGESVPSVHAASTERARGPQGTPALSASARANCAPAAAPAKGARRAPIATPTAQAGTAPCRSAQTVGTPLSMEGTGVKPWWTFRDLDVPGGPHVKANMTTGNLFVQGTDLRVPHKHVPLQFTRSYNSQSMHDVNGSDGGPPSLYGNGWTNTFDMHLAGGDGTGMISVYDADGARYDYTGSNATGWIPPPGLNANLAWDGGCGYVWKTRKDKKFKYYFYRPDYAAACGATLAGYAGRLYQVLGRNRNTSIALAYSWDGGIATAAGKVSQIVAQTESGLTATLYFGDVGTHRLLYQLVRPDGASVAYSYDANGSLHQVTRPSNNAPGTPLYEYYVSGQQPSGTITQNIIGGPRATNSWYANNNVQTDGGYLVFTFSTAATNDGTRLTEIDHHGFMNPNLGPAGQTYPASVPTGLTTYLREFYSPAPPGIQPTGDYVSDDFTDTDGHWAEYVADVSGRTKTNTVKVGSQYLNWGTRWDSSNNMTATIDPRGYETDYLYDTVGDITAIAKPQGTAAPVLFRPTQLFDYDPQGNVTAYCDESETHAAGADWAGQLTPGSTTLCSSLAGNVPHWTTTYSYPSYELPGELSSVTMPTGYVRNFTYDITLQGGADYGLPTLIAGAPMLQRDNFSNALSQRLVYNVHGIVVCSSAGASQYSNGSTTVFQYDSMNRLTAVSDPDDSSTPIPPNCQQSPGLSGSHTIVSRATYFPDGSLQTTQSPEEAAAGVSTSYTYDFDGNQTSISTNFGNVASTTTRWFDSADRLVAVNYPTVKAATRWPYLTSDVTWYERYLYDLSAGGSVTTLSGQTLTAHGNLYETTKTTGGGYAQIDTAMAAYDMLDRVTTAYAFAPCPSTGSTGPQLCNNAPYTTSYVYDAGSLTLGLLASQTDGLGEMKTFAYDSHGQTSAIQYSGDGGVTPAMTYSYDEGGHMPPLRRRASARTRIRTDRGASKDDHGAVVSRIRDQDVQLLSRSDVGVRSGERPIAVIAEDV